MIHGEQGNHKLSIERRTTTLRRKSLPVLTHTEGREGVRGTIRLSPLSALVSFAFRSQQIWTETTHYRCEDDARTSKWTRGGCDKHRLGEGPENDYGIHFRPFPLLAVCDFALSAVSTACVYVSSLSFPPPELSIFSAWAFSLSERWVTAPAACLALR